MTSKYKISLGVIAGIAALGAAGLTASKPAQAASPARALTAQVRPLWNGDYGNNGWGDRNLHSASFEDRLHHADRERHDREIREREAHDRAIREREWRKNHDNHQYDHRNWDNGKHDGWDKDHHNDKHNDWNKDNHRDDHNWNNDHHR